MAVILPPKGTLLTTAEYCFAALSIASDVQTSHTTDQAGQTTFHDDMVNVNLFISLQEYAVVTGRFPRYDAIEPDVRAYVDRVIAAWSRQPSMDMAAITHIVDVVNSIQMGGAPPQP